MSASELRALNMKMDQWIRVIEATQSKCQTLEQQLEELKRSIISDLERFAVNVSAMCEGQVSQHLQMHEHDLRESLQGDIIELIQKYRDVPR
jgi:hypothetical protein